VQQAAPSPKAAFLGRLLPIHHQQIANVHSQLYIRAFLLRIPNLHGFERFELITDQALLGLL